MDDCDRRELAAAWALGALDGEDARAFEVHLRGCPKCEADVEAYRDALLVLAHSAEPVEPPAALRARVLDAVAPPAREPRAEPLLVRLRRSRAAWGAGLAVAAAVAVLAVVVAHGPARPSPEALLGEQVAAEIALTPAGTGRVLIGSDGKVVAQVRLRPAPAGKVYEAWVMPKGDARTARAAGLLAGGEQTVVLTSRARRGDVVGFTLEPNGGSVEPTSAPVATARI